MADDGLPEDLHVIIVRRGEHMRVMLPMDTAGMWDTTPFEIASACIDQFLNLQAAFPGRADVPIIPGMFEMALTLPMALGPLDPEMMIGPQLMGQWSPLNLVVSEDTGVFMHDTPCCALNLVNLNRN